MKLAKYLKPFTFGILLTIVLLFIQAMTNLRLPNYMSDIVNIGIQQNGIEHAAPDAISENGYVLMLKMMNTVEKTMVEKYYTQVSPTDINADGQSYKTVYPEAPEAFYVLKEIDEEARELLDDAFGTATWTMIYTFQDMLAKSGRTDTAASMPSTSMIDLSQIYQYLPVLSGLPQEVMEANHQRAAESDAFMRKQSGIMLAKAFYSELGTDMAALQTAYIINIGLFMLGFALIGGITTVLVSLLASRIAAGVARNLRFDTFDKIESFLSNEFDTFSTASLITRCTNDITQIQLVLTIGLRILIYAPIMAIGGIIMAIDKAVSMSWIIAVSCITLIGMIIIVACVAIPKFQIMQKLVDKLNLVSRENLSGMMVIRAFNRQDYEKNRFAAANQDLTDISLFINRLMVLLMPVMMLIMNGTTLLIVWIGAHQISQTSIQVGDMMAFMQYAMQVIMSFLMLSMMFIFLPRAAVSGKRIFEVLSTVNAVSDPENPEGFDETKKGSLEFQNVSFRFRGAEADMLKNITFTASPGQTTAIIGPTGSGKSTIANLILRFYDVSSGRILVDGTDIRHVRQKDLREKIGYVPQKGVLLSGSIESNLTYGSNAVDSSQIEKAAQIAQALEFINEKADRFDSEISQDGTNVSGGQKQRLSIARALVKNPEILIFDDSFSALDFRTDSALRKALKEHTGHQTVIIVSQRVSTIMNAEQILVLDNGAIAGIGTHKELMKNCPQYKEIALSQLSQEELS